MLPPVALHVTRTLLVSPVAVNATAMNCADCFGVSAICRGETTTRLTTGSGPATGQVNGTGFSQLKSAARGTNNSSSLIKATPTESLCLNVMTVVSSKGRCRKGESCQDS